MACTRGSSARALGLLALAQHPAHRVARDLQRPADVAQRPALVLEHQDRLADLLSDHGSEDLHQGLFQALELGFRRGEGLAQALALQRPVAAANSVGTCRHQPLEDRTDHRQVFAPGRLRDPRPGACRRFPARGSPGPGETVRGSPPGVGAGRGSLARYWLVQPLELTGGQGLLLELREQGAGVVAVGARQRCQDAGGRPHARRAPGVPARADPRAGP